MHNLEIVFHDLFALKFKEKSKIFQACKTFRLIDYQIEKFNMYFGFFHMELKPLGRSLRNYEILGYSTISYFGIRGCV